jgi:polyisoprenoid-binding protein YceI
MGRLRVALLVVLVVLVAGGGATWWFLLRDDSPPPPRLEACADGASTDLRSADDGSLDGTWMVVGSAGDDDEAVEGDGDGSQEGHYVGYRISEVFGGDVVSRNAVARTSDVAGTLTIAGDVLTDAVVTADVSSLRSTDAASGGRDRYLRTNALETDEFPEARFDLTEPLELGPLPEAGACVQVEAVGLLTLRDTEAPVMVALDAIWHDGAIELAGQAPIVLGDFGIDAPDVAGFATVADEGAFELRLRLVPADG